MARSSTDISQLEENVIHEHTQYKGCQRYLVSKSSVLQHKNDAGVKGIHFIPAAVLDTISCNVLIPELV
jgi:hypothetical protein